MSNTAPKPIAKGDRVSFYTNRGLVEATGTVEDVWTGSDGIEVARVDVDPSPFVLSAIPSIVEVRELARIKKARGAR